MYMTAKIIAEKLVAKRRSSKVSTRQFLYDTFYFATLDNKPITLERFVDSEFTKHVNNNGNPCQRFLVKALYSSKQRLCLCAFFLWSKQREVSVGWFTNGGS